MENAIIKEIEEWFSERHTWLQDATNRAIESFDYSDKDIKELLLLCKKEAGILDSSISGMIPKKFIKGSLNGVENSCDLTLEGISNLTGIGALAPKKPLEFESKPLAIVYGRNGSGKSSYVRAIKHACGARNPGKLLNDVYNPQNVKQGCVFKVRKGIDKKDITWSSDDGINDELKAIEIYDSDCAQVYVNSENEITYEPWILSLFTRLTECCSRVSQELQHEIDQNVSKKPTLPEEFKTTQAGIWYSKLTCKTSNKDVEKRCLWNDELENELSGLRKRLAESNPSEKAKLLRKKKSNIDLLLQNIKLLETGLSKETCSNYFTLKSDTTLKKKVADEDAKKVFEAAPLDGVGSESWKLLWEQARVYSEMSAYPDTIFPNISENARCVLCHQPLDGETKNRLSSFEEFIKGNLEKQAKEAETTFLKFVDGITQIQKDEVIDLLLSSADITDEAEVANIRSIFTCFQKRRESLFVVDHNDKVAEMPDTTTLDYLYEQINTIEEQACVYDVDATSDNRDVIQINIKELETQKWMSQQKKSIEEEVDRLNKINQLDQAKRLTSTQALSIKKSELSDKLVTEAYIERFQSELKSLGASHIKIELVKTRAQKGHIYHQIKLRGCTNGKCTEILSEGELRIVSLAAFLADVEGRKENTPFVFDDPISSLDQDYEEATVRRLIQLCEHRQVIIFTHRLSLITLLEEAAKKTATGISFVCLRSEHWGVGEPSDIPINAKKPKEALDNLINDRLGKARKIFNDFGRTEYDLIAKGICSDFRILVERFIEYDLLGDVVHRFRRAVNTIGKLERLTIIRDEDCKLLDSFMTEYSRYEHSQSDELPVELPEPDKLKEDMEKLKSWHAEFSKRTV